MSDPFVDLIMSITDEVMGFGSDDEHSPKDVGIGGTGVLEKPKPREDLKPSGREDHVDYFKLAEDLDFIFDRSGPIRDFFLQHHIPIYDNDEVVQYMDSIVPSGNIWVWKPLRPIDVRSVPPARRSDMISNKLYDRAIPLHILQRVKLMKDQFPQFNEVQIFVTDYQAPVPDPFIMVRFQSTDARRSSEPVIFGMWDEPGFDDMKTEVG